ncbi:MAG TPA: hypothetical protein PLB27_13045, partial [Bacteroidales bacterium]|nr:hypothetical protein [Bacteroidales bacterium]
IFQHLYDNGGYTRMGLTFLLIPLAGWIIFYFLWKYPYSKLWHWLVWTAVMVLVVALVTNGIANSEIFNSGNQTLNELLADTETGYAEYARSLPMKYVLANSLLALILSFLYSLLLKQFSRIHVHLPF